MERRDDFAVVLDVDGVFERVGGLVLADGVAGHCGRVCRGGRIGWL